MAKMVQGVLGPFIGKLGPSVGYIWRGRAMVRAYVRHIRFPNTEAQLIERDWFVGMVRFAAAARGVLTHGMQKSAARAVMSEANYFVMSNKRRFDHGGSVDYRALQFSEGPVAPLWGAWREVDGDGVLTAGWQRQPSQKRSKGGDVVHLYVYHPVERCGVVAEGRRRDGRLAVALPDGWTAEAVHCYLFATDAQGFASRTVYVDSGEAMQLPSRGAEGAAPRLAEGQQGQAEAMPGAIAGAFDLHLGEVLVDDGLG